MHISLDFSYQLKRSARATRTRIIVRPGQVEVVAPTKATERQVTQFVKDKQDWIIQTLKKMEQHAKQPDRQGPIPKQFTEHNQILYLGQLYSPRFLSTSLKRLKIEFNGQFTIHLPDGLIDGQHDANIRKALIEWYKKQTLIHVQQHISRHATRKNLYPKTVSVRAQKSRWGSCGSQGDIHINWLLVMAPPEILEYVVIHELCHLKERNHSSRFWDLVTEHMPDYKKCRQWLKQQGGHLMLYHLDKDH